MSKPRTCIVSHHALGALRGGAEGHVGGVEWQTSLTARWLAARGYPVSMLTWDEGQDEDVVVDGVRVIKMCRRDQGLPGLRFFYPRWTSLDRALRKADADVYYHNCAEYVTGQVAWWCRRHGRKFVYSVASNLDCDPRLPELRKWRERVLYRHGLRRADRVIVQTRGQQALLRSGFGVPAEVIPMPCPGPVNGQYTPPEPPGVDTARIVWVGRISPIKRLELLLDVAAMIPETSFDVVGTTESENEYTRGLRERAASLPNVTLCGHVPRVRMPEVYRGASCLCCTSEVEGFPNTFLEAWSFGVPVVSTYDPDALIASEGLGAAVQDARGLVGALRELLATPTAWAAASRRARQYYLDNHTVDAVMPQFERVFVQTAADRPENRA